MMATTMSTLERRTSQKWEQLTCGKDIGEFDYKKSGEDLNPLSFNTGSADLDECDL